MYTLFIFIGLFIISLVIAFLIRRNNSNQSVWDSIEDVASGWLTYGILISLIFWAITTAILNSTLEPRLVSKTPLKEKIYSLNLQNDKQISGSFILGIGGFGSSNNIQYIMYKAEEGGKKLYKTNDYETIIYEDENTEPYLVEYYYEVLDISKIKNWVLFEHISTGTYRDGTYRLHVPQNTVKVNYNLDLQTVNN
jgi:hypothetical protein